MDITSCPECLPAVRLAGGSLGATNTTPGIFLSTVQNFQEVAMDVLDSFDAVQDVCCQLVFLSASVGAMLREEDVSEAVSHGLSLVLDRMAEELQAAIDANSAARRA